MLELLLLLLLLCLPPFIDLYQTTHSSDMLVPAPSEPLRLPAFAPAAEEQTDCLLWAKSPAQKTFCLFRRWSALWKKHTHNRWNASWKKRNEEESPNLKNSQHQSILLPSSYFLLCWTRRLLIITDLLWCFHVCSDYSSHRSAAVHASSVAAASSVFLSEAAILLCFWTQNQLQKLSSVQLWGSLLHMKRTHKPSNKTQNTAWSFTNQRGTFRVKHLPLGPKTNNPFFKLFFFQKQSLACL